MLVVPTMSGIFLRLFVAALLVLRLCDGHQQSEPSYSSEPAQTKEQPSCVTDPARVETQRKDSAPELKLSADPHAWALAITSGGGLIGGGAGNLRVDSEGALQR